MAWTPIITGLQYEDANGNPYSGAVLKAYTAGTSTNINLATSSSGATTATSIALNASGYPVVSGNIVLPHVDREYKLALYPTQAAADANSGAIWTIDNISVAGDFGLVTQSISTNTALDSTDAFNHIEASGTITITLPDIDVVGSGFVFTIRNTSTGLVTLDGDGAETINGGATIILYPGDSALVISSATAWSATGYKGPQAEVDIASASTTSIGAAGGFNVRITGTTGITGFGTSAAGLRINGRFAAALTLTYNATSMILNTGGSNYTTAANDRFEAFSLGSGNWIVNITKQDGSAPKQSIPYNSIGGFNISSIAGNSTTASLTVGVGSATDDTGVYSISKSTTTSWAASNGNAINGTDAASSTLANSETYHVFMCYGSSGTGSFVSASLSPTLPTGYNTYKRRVGSFTTNGSGAPIAYTSIEIHGGGVVNYLATQVEDINNQQPASASRTSYALSVPTDIKVQPMFRVTSVSSVAGAFIITSPDETDVAPDTITGGNYYSHFTAVPGWDFGSTGSTGSTIHSTGIITTNTSAQICIRQTATHTNTINLDTRGWIDFRRS